MYGEVKPGQVRACRSVGAVSFEPDEMALIFVGGGCGSSFRVLWFT